VTKGKIAVAHCHQSQKVIKNCNKSLMQMMWLYCKNMKILQWLITANCYVSIVHALLIASLLECTCNDI